MGACTSHPKKLTTQGLKQLKVEELATVETAETNMSAIDITEEVNNVLPPQIFKTNDSRFRIKEGLTTVI